MGKPLIFYRDIGFLSVAQGNWPCECGALADEHTLKQIGANKWLLGVAKDGSAAFFCNSYMPMRSSLDAQEIIAEKTKLREAKKKQRVKTRRLRKRQANPKKRR